MRVIDDIEVCATCNLLVSSGCAHSQSDIPLPSHNELIVFTLTLSLDGSERPQQTMKSPDCVVS